MKLLLFFTVLFGAAAVIDYPGLTEVRELYYKAAADKQAAVKLSLLLSPVDTGSLPLFVCYKGASEMMKAKYAVNPFNKLTAFKSGKVLIEKSIKRDTANIEMRFIRFSIQSNLPDLLGYNTSLTADKMMLLAKISSTADTSLKRIVINYLANPKYCTEDEIKKLKSD